MKITVFTPPYNRGYIIGKLYESLKNQSYKDFEWVVIDDGSTDATVDLFRIWKCENNFFPITYLKVPNGGKHRAINKGAQIAKGELFYIVDSDDYLPDNALEIITQKEATIPEDIRHKFCGVCGDRYIKNIPNAHHYKIAGDYLDITMLDRDKYGIYGDRAEVFYTRILKNYPFPEFEGENFCTECIVWDKIAHDGYKMRFFQQIIYICEYLEDGLTNNHYNYYKHNPKSYGLYTYQSIKFGKYKGFEKYIQITKYFLEFKEMYTFRDIARNLHYTSLGLLLRLCYHKIFSIHFK